MALVAVGDRPRRGGGAGRCAARSRSIPHGHEPLTLRSDNGLVFGAQGFVSVVRRYGLEQEYITPYSPEQNGMIERFFLTLKQEVIRAAPVRGPRPRLPRRGGLARSLSRGPAHTGARLSHAERIPGDISGLTCTGTRGTPQTAVLRSSPSDPPPSPARPGQRWTIGWQLPQSGTRSLAGSSL